jgi:hypothetical protein
MFYELAKSLAKVGGGTSAGTRLIQPRRPGNATFGLNKKPEMTPKKGRDLGGSLKAGNIGQVMPKKPGKEGSRAITPKQKLASKAPKMVAPGASLYAKTEEAFAILEKHVYSTDNSTATSTIDAVLPYQVIPKLLVKFIKNATNVNDSIDMPVPGTDYKIQLSKDTGNPHLFLGTLTKVSGVHEIVSKYEKSSIPQICLDIMLKAGITPEEHKQGGEIDQEVASATKSILQLVDPPKAEITIDASQIKARPHIEDFDSEQYEFSYLPSPEIEFGPHGIKIRFDEGWSKADRARFAARLLFKLGGGA